MGLLKTYITFLGRSAWAVINCYYAVVKLKDYFPELIYIVTEDLFKDQVDNIVNGLTIISENFGFTPQFDLTIVENAEFIDAGNKINNIIKKLKDFNHKIAVDITPGRKALVAGTLIPLSKIQVDHIFYLAIDTLKDANKPYEMIPFQIQSLKDFIMDSK